MTANENLAVAIAISKDDGHEPVTVALEVMLDIISNLYAIHQRKIQQRRGNQFVLTIIFVTVILAIAATTIHAFLVKKSSRTIK